jgi:hypothetical protein
MRENPYQPPRASDDRPPPRPHGRAIRSETWRGAKFGAVLAGGIMAAIVLVGAAILLCVGWAEGRLFVKPISPYLVGRFVGGMTAAILLTAFYGAVCGAVIMGVAAAVRKRFVRDDPSRATDANAG